jgi:carbon storage regulator|tara:strand:+ start:5245 stop:5424 length:180 start_codon:yes stop_codon:yes gene_type:complete
MPTLSLKRKAGEAIVIGDNIRIEIIEVQGSRVKIAITAPKDVRIDREEVRINKDMQKNT